MNNLRLNCWPRRKHGLVQHILTWVIRAIFLFFNSNKFRLFFLFCCFFFVYQRSKNRDTENHAHKDRLVKRLLVAKITVNKFYFNTSSFILSLIHYLFVVACPRQINLYSYLPWDIWTTSSSFGGTCIHLTLTPQIIIKHDRNSISMALYHMKQSRGNHLTGPYTSTIKVAAQWNTCSFLFVFSKMYQWIWCFV